MNPDVQLAAGSYFIDRPTSATRTAYLSGFQTRLFVSTRIFWALITLLSLSTALTFLAQLLQQRAITLPIDTSPDMLITTLKLGRSPDIIALGDLRRYNPKELERKLSEHKWRLEDGQLVKVV